MCEHASAACNTIECSVAFDLRFAPRCSCDFGSEIGQQIAPNNRPLAGEAPSA
jgi:hypothetical protein